MIKITTVKGFVIGMALGALVSACASTVFPYKFYGLDLKDGKLLGNKPENDLDLSTCAATETDASPCMAILTKDYLQLKTDYKNVVNQLDACQRGH